MRTADRMGWGWMRRGSEGSRCEIGAAAVAHSETPATKWPSSLCSEPTREFLVAGKANLVASAAA
jgi:hypothetical protein